MKSEIVWIDVEDYLPSDFTEVITYSKKYGIMQALFETDSFQKFTFVPNNEKPTIDADFWAELPTMPKRIKDKL